MGANSPTDLASRPRRVILSDEIDKYPTSAGAEGDPLKLAEERASTYLDVGRGKLVRTCSPTVKGVSRIAREYEASDQRRCFVACPHCGHEQTLTWAAVTWEKVLEDGTTTYDVPEGQRVREHRPETAAIVCAGDGCGALWSEEERKAALRALEHAPDHGWRQTQPFVCCGERQAPASWNGVGRALCGVCGDPAPYSGHAGFQASKLYSARHKLRTVVAEFLDAKGDPELLKTWTNTAMAETWEPAIGTSFDGSRLAGRAEVYGPDDLPEAVQAITGFADVQGDRLEVQLVGWGAEEEAWPFLYEVRGGRSCRTPVPSIAISRVLAAPEDRWMALPDAPPFASTFPADDEVEDARWLASLIMALRAHAEQQGHPEVAAALDPALDAAQAIVADRTAH